MARIQANDCIQLGKAPLRRGGAGASGVLSNYRQAFSFALPASQYWSTPQQPPSKIGIFPGYPTTLNDFIASPFRLHLPPTCHTTTFVVKFSQATSRGRWWLAHLPLRPPSGRLGVERACYYWLRPLCHPVLSLSSLSLRSNLHKSASKTNTRTIRIGSSIR